MKTNGVPKIRFKGFTDDWEQRKFGEMFARRMERNNGEFDNTKWISVARMYYQTPDKVTSNNIDTRTYVMRKGDIAFEGHSNSEFKYGRFVANDIGDGVISELFPIYKHIDKYDLNYWKYAIQLESLMQSKLVKCIEISYTSSNKLDKDSFLKEKIPVASLAEQEKIGEYFSNLDRLITLHQRKCEQTKELKKFMLQKMFPKKGEKNPEIRFPGFTDDWEQRKLREITSLITKGTTPKNKTGNGEINFIKVENIDSSSGEIKDYLKISIEEHEGYLKRSQLKENDILFSIAGTLGRTAVVNKRLLPANTNQALAILRTSEGDISYIITVLKGKAVSDFVRKNPTVGAQPNLSLEQVSNLEISYPSIDEQVKIGEFFSCIDNLITLHQRKCEQLKELKKFMLQNMFPKKG